ncbi:MAG: type III-A CRISPR-associated RAMP protein Csm3 [Deltaproteobacteria bacterium]|nr:type III-A CRISPR-associated RAMP protein Csm3 [Deltaproteobacteria bacterium]
MQLIEIKEIKGKIILKSGLHIGAGDTEMHIGGTDNPVVKHPHNQQPYIPGSSLKGKVRSLLEMRSGLMIKTDGKPLQAKNLKGLEGNEKADCLNILKIFGTSGADSDESTDLGPTRVSFADCPLNDEWLNDANIKRLNLTEVKSENSINRVKGTAENPRFTERVPADTIFNFNATLKILGKDEEPLLDYLLKGLKLLEMDALGGSGSRGYGKVCFDFQDEGIRQKFENINPF